MNFSPAIRFISCWTVALLAACTQRDCVAHPVAKYLRFDPAEHRNDDENPLLLPITYTTSRKRNRLTIDGFYIPLPADQNRKQLHSLSITEPSAGGNIELELKSLERSFKLKLEQPGKTERKYVEIHHNQSLGEPSPHLNIPWLLSQMIRHLRKSKISKGQVSEKRLLNHRDLLYDVQKIDTDIIFSINSTCDELEPALTRQFGNISIDPLSIRYDPYKAHKEIKSTQTYSTQIISDKSLPGGRFTIGPIFIKGCGEQTYQSGSSYFWGGKDKGGYYAIGINYGPCGQILFTIFPVISELENHQELAQELLGPPKDKSSTLSLSFTCLSEFIGRDSIVSGSIFKGAQFLRSNRVAFFPKAHARRKQPRAFNLPDIINYMSSLMIADHVGLFDWDADMQPGWEKALADLEKLLDTPLKILTPPSATRSAQQVVEALEPQLEQITHIHIDFSSIFPGEETAQHPPPPSGPCEDGSYASWPWPFGWVHYISPGSWYYNQNVSAQNEDDSGADVDANEDTRQKEQQDHSIYNLTRSISSLSLTITSQEEPGISLTPVKSRRHWPGFSALFIDSIAAVKKIHFRGSSSRQKKLPDTPLEDQILPPQDTGVEPDIMPAKPHKSLFHHTRESGHQILPGPQENPMQISADQLPLSPGTPFREPMAMDMTSTERPIVVTLEDALVTSDGDTIDIQVIHPSTADQSDSDSEEEQRRKCHDVVQQAALPPSFATTFATTEETHELVLNDIPGHYRSQSLSDIPAPACHAPLKKVPSDSHLYFSGREQSDFTALSKPKVPKLFSDSASGASEQEPENHKETGLENAISSSLQPKWQSNESCNNTNTASFLRNVSALGVTGLGYCALQAYWMIIDSFDSLDESQPAIFHLSPLHQAAGTSIAYPKL